SPESRLRAPSMPFAPEPSRTTISVPASVPVAVQAPRPDDPSLYINRELSWLEFNARVLAEADDSRVPLYERAKFLAIFAANLDEFFMVRVAGLQAQQSGEVEESTADGMTPLRQLAAISERALELTTESYRIWNALRPELRREGVALVSASELDAKEQATLDEYFTKEIFPALTPIAIDPVH